MNIICTFFQKKYIAKLPIAENKKNQSTFFNFVAYVMQIHYKDFIQKTITEYTGFMTDQTVINNYKIIDHFINNYAYILVNPVNILIIAYFTTGTLLF